MSTRKKSSKKVVAPPKEPTGWKIDPASVIPLTFTMWDARNPSITEVLGLGDGKDFEGFIAFGVKSDGTLCAATDPKSAEMAIGALYHGGGFDGEGVVYPSTVRVFQVGLDSKPEAPKPEIQTEVQP